MKPVLQSVLFAAVPLLLLLSLSAGAATAPAGKASPMKPRTLVVEKGLIRSFAQDTSSIAWVGAGCRVHVRSLLTGHGAIVGNAQYLDGSCMPPDLAVAGTRALWTKFEGGNAPETSLWTAALGESGVAVDLFMGNSGEPGGSLLGGMAGDGTTLLYGRTHEGCSPPPWPPAPCPTLEATGGVVAVTGQYQASPINGIPPAAMLAFAAHDPRSGRISQGRLAVVPAASPVVDDLGNVPRAAENGNVQVYWILNNLVTLSSVSPRGTVKAIALRFGQLAVLVQRPDGTQALERYDSVSGALIGATVVPKRTASELSISSAGIVYRVGAKIYLVRGSLSGLVWKAQGTPIGLSIEGRRIAWAVNIKGHGRIVALTLR